MPNIFSSLKHLLFRALLPEGYRNVMDYGAVGNGQADDTKAIQQAIDGIPTRGGTLLFPPGTYRITETIVIGNGSPQGGSTQNNIRLLGCGRSSGAYFPENPEAATVTFRYDGPAGNSAIHVKGPLNGFSMESFRIVTGKAIAGLQLTWIRQSLIRDLGVVGSPGNDLRYGLILNVWENAPSWPGACGNHFEQLFIDTSNSPRARALVLNGAPAVNVDPHRNSFMNLVLQYHGGRESAGIVLAFTDSNTFYETDAISLERGAGDGPGLALDCVLSSNGDSFPLNNAFYNCSVGKGGVMRWGDKTLKPPMAAFFFPAPTQDNETYDKAKGLVFGFRDDRCPRLWL